MSPASSRRSASPRSSSASRCRTSVGSIVSGLFLIFEAPFELGDWIETGGTRGQIVEVNWRAVHLDTGNGIVVMPTAELAEGSFVEPLAVARPVRRADGGVVRRPTTPPVRVRDAPDRGRARHPARRREPRADRRDDRQGDLPGGDPAARRRATSRPCSTRSRRASGTPRAAPSCTSTATSPTTGTAPERLAGRAPPDLAVAEPSSRRRPTALAATRASSATARGR